MALFRAALEQHRPNDAEDGNYEEDREPARCPDGVGRFGRLTARRHGAFLNECGMNGA